MNARATVGSLARHVVLVSTSLVILAPFIWMVSLSFKPPSEMFEVPFRILPEHFYGWENYRAALSATPIPRYFLNGVIVCTGILLCQVATAAPVAYALAKIDFRGKRWLFGGVLVGMLIPSQALALPLFILLYQLGMLDTYAGLILPSAVSPFAIFLLRQYFRTIPDDLVHAARLDGLGEWSIVWRIMVPLAKPAIGAFAILSVVMHWNDLFWPSIVIQSPEMATPPLGVLFFKNSEAGDSYGPLMAAAVIVIAPLIIAFAVAQRHFIDGLSMARPK